jgi:hypothetical protein
MVHTVVSGRSVPMCQRNTLLPWQYNIILKLETVYSAETLVTTYQTIQYHKSEDYMNIRINQHVRFWRLSSVTKLVRGTRQICHVMPCVIGSEVHTALLSHREVWTTYSILIIHNPHLYKNKLTPNDFVRNSQNSSLMLCMHFLCSSLFTCHDPIRSAWQTALKLPQLKIR